MPNARGWLRRERPVLQLSRDLQGELPISSVVWPTQWRGLRYRRHAPPGLPSQVLAARRPGRRRGLTNEGSSALALGLIESVEWLLSATSGSSWIRRQWSDDVSLNDRFRLGAALQLVEKTSPRQAATGQTQTLVNATSREELQLFLQGSPVSPEISFPQPHQSRREPRSLVCCSPRLGASEPLE